MFPPSRKIVEKNFLTNKKESFILDVESKNDSIATPPYQVKKMYLEN